MKISYKNSKALAKHGTLNKDLVNIYFETIYLNML